MTTFGAHELIWTSEWTGDSPRRICQEASAAGADFIEITLLDPQRIDADATRQVLQETGLECTCGLALPEDAHIPLAPERAREFLKQAVDVAAAVGSTVLTGAIYLHPRTLSGRPPTSAEIATTASVLKDVARYGQAAGVGLGIETINRYESYLLNLVQQALEMLERIDEPNVFIHLDTYHMNIEESSLYEAVVSAGDQLRYLHASESHRGIPGTGTVPWNDVFRGLRDVHYQGRIALESFGAVGDEVRSGTCMWRDVVGEPRAFVESSLRFLRLKAAEYSLLHD